MRSPAGKIFRSSFQLLCLWVVGIMVLAPLLLGSNAYAQDISWTGAGDGTSWEDPFNWSTGTVPVATSNVAINANIGESYTVVLSSETTISSLNLGISQATLELQDGLNITGTMNQTFGTLSGNADLIISGQLSWRGGRMEGSGGTFLNGGAEITGGAGSSGNNKTLDQRRLVVPDGQVFSFNGALFTGRNGASIDIQEGATFDLITNSSSNVMRMGDGGATIINAGTISKSQGTTFPINIEWDLENSGLLSVSQQDAELQWWGSLLDQGGQYIVEVGFLRFDLPASDVPYLFTPDSRLLAGPGARMNLGSRDGVGSETIYELQGTVEMDGIFSVKNFNGGTAASVTIPATANLVSLGGEQLLVGASRGQLFVEITDPISVGDLTVGASGWLELSSSLTVTGDYTQNNASALLASNFDVTIEGELAWSGGRMEGAGTTVANGGVNVTGGAGSSSNNKALDQRRLVIPSGQVFTFNGSLFTGQNGAIIDIQEGALFDLITGSSGNVMRVGDGGATIINAGTILKSQGTTFPINVEWDLQNSGLLSVSQQDAVMQWQGALTDQGGRYIVEVGFLDLALPTSETPYVFTADSRLLAGPGARINLSSRDGMGSETRYQLLGSVEMDGTFSVKNFNGSTTPIVTIPATANLGSLGGELLLVGASRGQLFVEITDPISVGDLTVGSIGRLELSSPLTVNGSYTQNNVSAVIASDFDIAVGGELAWSGGRMEGVGTTFLNGGAVITGGPGSSGNNKTLNQRRLVVPNGQVFTFNGALFTGQNGAEIEIQEGALFNLITGSSGNVMRVGDGGATIINAGTILKSQGTTFPINIEWDLQNSGLLSVSQQDAVLQWQGALTDDGGQYIVEVGFLDLDLPASAVPYVFTPDSRLLAGPGARVNLGSSAGDGTETLYELQGTVEMDGIFSVKNFSGGNPASVTIPATANLVSLGGELLLVGTSRGQLFVEITDPISVGDLTVGSIGRLELSSPLTVNGSYTQNNASAVIVSDFDITVGGELAWSGGRMEGAGTTLLNGGAVITGGPGSSGNNKTLNQRRLVVPNGQVFTFNGSSFTGLNGASIDIEEGGLFDLVTGSGNNVMRVGEGGAIINNYGTFSKSQGTTFQINIEWDFRNAGLLSLAQQDADLRLWQSLLIDEGGQYIVEEGYLSFDLGPSDTPYVFTPDSRLLAGPGARINLGNRTNDGSSVSYELQGSVEMNGTFSVRGNNTAIATIPATASLESLGGESLLVGGNRGQLFLETSDPISIGDLSVGFAGRLELSSPMTVSGNYTQNHSSGVVASDFDIIVEGELAWSGGRMEGIGRTIANGSGTMTGGGTSSTKTLSERTLVIPNGQEFVYSGSRTTGRNGAVLEIEEGAIFRLDTESSVLLFVADEGGATIKNAGTFQKSQGTTFQIDVQWALENTGSLLISQDETDIRFREGIQNSGTIDISSSSALLVSDESIINEGTIRGIGTINGSVGNTTGTVQPGIDEENTGILTIQGNYTQSETGTLSIKIGGTEPGTEYDRLVTSSSTLNGTIELLPLNEFVFADSDEIVPLTWNEGNRTGEFSIVDDTAFSETLLAPTYSPDGLILNSDAGNLPETVVLISPVNGAIDISANPILLWEAATDASSYQVQVSTEENFSTTVVDQAGIDITELQVDDLSFETTFYWRVRGVNDVGQGDWSAVWSFTTEENTSRPFITTWKTDNPGNSGDTTIRIPMIGNGYDFTVDWGDGIEENYNNSPGDGIIHNLDHEYAVAGIYEIKINGNFPRIYIDFYPDRSKPQSVEQWGDIQWQSMERAFAGAENLVINASDIPKLTNVTNMSGMLRGVSEINSDLSEWNVGGVTNMEAVFQDVLTFNGDIDSWDVSSVEEISRMFQGATSFNRDLSGWDFSSIKFMSSMFSGATAFDQNLGGWNIPDGTDMWGALNNAGLSVENYDNSLIGWNNQPIKNVNLGAIGLEYCNGKEARQELIDVHNWRFSNDSEAADCDTGSAPGIVVLSSPVDEATDVSINPELAWEPAEGADTYQLQVATNESFANLVSEAGEIEATEFQVEALEFETIYYWRVRGDNNIGPGEWSVVWSFTTEEEPLTLPGVVELSSPEDGAIDVSINPELTWEPTEGADTYQLQVSTDESFMNPVADESGLEVTEFQVVGLVVETTYFWRVRGVNEAGQGDWSAVWTFSTEFTQPETPVNFVLDQQNEFPRLRWEASSSASGHRFNIYRGVSPRALERIETVDADVLSYVDDQIPEGIFFYAVSSISSGGSESPITTSLSFVNEFLQAGSNWKLASIPILNSELDADLAALYSYEEKYFRESRLIPLTGYWMKTRTFDTENILVNGLGLLNAEFNLEKGWNLIGSLSDSVHVDMILDQENILTDTPIYIYESDSYVATEYMVPNQGHWVFAEEAGTVAVDVQNSLMLLATSSSETPGQSFNDQAQSQQSDIVHHNDARLVIENGQSKTHLHIRHNPVDNSELPAYYLPPLSPDPVLDVRLGDNTNLLQSDMEMVFVKTSGFPLYLTIESETHKTIAYRLNAYSDNKKAFTLDLIPGQLQRAEREFDYFTLEQLEEDEIVRSDQLVNSYPNPFNPSTTIQFELAETTQVQIEVFDVVGRRVRVLAAEEYQAGQHFVTFRADNLSSGIYFVRFQTPGTVNLRKITLMK